MSLTVLKLSDIEAGALEETIQEKLEELARDIERRPSLTRARKLKIIIEMTPIAREDKARASVGPVHFALEWRVGHDVPGSRGMTSRGFVIAGKAKINADDPMEPNPDQGNIFEVKRKKEQTA